jgi:hypothetical protein
VGEYALCADAFGWDDATVATVAATSLEACFIAARRGLAGGSLVIGRNARP